MDKKKLINYLENKSNQLKQKNYFDISTLHDGEPPYYAGYQMNQIVYTSNTSLLTDNLPKYNNLPIPFGGHYDFQLVKSADFVIDKSIDLSNMEFICIYPSPSIFGANTFQFFFHPWLFRYTQINNKENNTTTKIDNIEAMFSNETSNIFELDNNNRLSKDKYNNIHQHAHDNVYSVKQGQIGIKPNEIKDNKYAYCKVDAKNNNRNITVHAFILDTTTFQPYNVGKNYKDLNLKELLKLMIMNEYNKYNNNHLLEKIISLL